MIYTNCISVHDTSNWFILCVALSLKHKITLLYRFIPGLLRGTPRQNVSCKPLLRRDNVSELYKH